MEEGEQPRRDPGASAALDVPGGSRVRADEWALVLVSQGVPCVVARSPHGFVVEVGSADQARARFVLAAYLRENPHAAVDDAEANAGDSIGSNDPTRASTGSEPLVPAIAVGFALAVLFVVTGDRTHGHTFFAQGSAHAGLIQDGQWWRTVTALCLHADLPHVIGNVVFGLYFLTAVCRSLGSGLGLTLVLVAGAGGNLLNAVTQNRSHDSVGASTAVFGAIGLLAGMALARRQRAGERGARLLLPIGAGLGLLAMLGTSGARVDLWAHLDGLVTGVALGVVSILALPRPPTARVQWLLGISSGLFVLFCWSLAMR
jgi:membrane associated rhomboid family serine protease